MTVHRLLTFDLQKVVEPDPDKDQTSKGQNNVEREACVTGLNMPAVRDVCSDDACKYRAESVDTYGDPPVDVVEREGRTRPVVDALAELGVEGVLSTVSPDGC